MRQFQWLISAEDKSRETLDITAYKTCFRNFDWGGGAAARQSPPSLGAPLIVVYNTVKASKINSLPTRNTPIDRHPHLRPPRTLVA